MRAQIRRDNAIAGFFEKLTEKLDKPSESGSGSVDALGGVIQSLTAAAGTGSGVQDPFLAGNSNDEDSFNF